MGYVKKAAPHICAVLKGMLFIGFSVQIALGAIWTCCNFGKVQSFGEPDAALYRAALGLLGDSHIPMQLIQLSVAFLAGYFFLQKLQPTGILFAVWRGLALLTFPFALQCHLALQPHSLIGSLFLLMLLLLLKTDRKRAVPCVLSALACLAAMAALSGIADGDRREEPGYSFEGALASRLAWPTLWNDSMWYGEEVTEVTSEVLWEASLYADNMRLFQEALEQGMGTEAAKKHYLHIAQVGWLCHKSMVIRQIGWDALGYAVTPVIFPLQMAGRAYDSYSGRNYEIMREYAPVLTKHYVGYGCWWFGWMLVTALFLAIAEALRGSGEGDPAGTGEAGKVSRRRLVLSMAVCVFCSGLLVAGLTMRGAGRMDYKCTIAVNELWLAGGLLLMGRTRRERI